MIKDFINGFTHVWSGLAALTTPGLGRFVLWPVAISVAVFALVIAAAVSGFDALIDWLVDWLPGWLGWLQWVLWPFLVMAGLLIAIYTFTLLANLIGAPFNGVLSAQYEARLRGVAPPADERSVIAAGLASLVIEIRKLMYLVRWLLLAAVLFIIPVVNLIAPFVWMAMGAWLLALEYVGYPMDNHAVGATQQRRLLAGRRSMALGFGAGIMLLSSVPVLNLLAMPAAVLGATRMWPELGQTAQLPETTGP